MGDTIWMGLGKCMKEKRKNLTIVQKMVQLK
jgi:hypothetical protein